MKRNRIAALVLLVMLSVVCTACGGNETASAEPTQLPLVTAPPNGSEGEVIGMLIADDNTAPERVDREAWLASLSEEQRLVEEKLIGATVDELYDAIGKPINLEYTTSCVVADGEDGLLYYDGFYVATTRCPNGTEYVMGTDN